MELFEELVSSDEDEVVTYETAPKEIVYKFRLTGDGEPALLSFRLKLGEKLPLIKERQTKGKPQIFECHSPCDTLKFQMGERLVSISTRVSSQRLPAIR